jgi:hypothetical protein
LSATSWQKEVTVCQQHHSENKLLFVSNIMVRTITICQQHHGENKFLFVSNIMARTSYYLSTTSWREQVSICQQHHG